METKPKILVVDDERLNINVLVDLLKPNYKMMAAINGAQALKAARGDAPPDLILLDIMMPEMDGYEVCRLLKEDPKTKDIPVVFVTAMGQEEDEKKGLELGAVDYITKPIVSAVVEARVKTHVALRRNMLELHHAYQVIETQKKRMQDELSIGRDIQLSMLPNELPASRQSDAYSVHGSMRAAMEVGGDFYDYFFIDEDHLALCVGDVSGKGVPAALFMSITKALIRSRASNDCSPASILTHVNHEIATDNESCMFITVFLCILNVRTGKMLYTNAGHNPPFLRRADGSIERFGTRHGPVIGAVEGLAFGEDEATLAKDDFFLIYSDGVTEAMNPEKELFEEDRLTAVLKSRDFPKPEIAVELMMEAIDEFADSADQFDDITLLGVVYHQDGISVEAQSLHMKIPNDLAEIDGVIDQVEEFGQEHKLALKPVRMVMMALDEFLNNAISYGFKDEDTHEIEIRIDLLDQRLSVTLVDDGIPFNPFQLNTPDTSLGVEDREIGGLGIHLVRNTMDEVSYKRGVNQNIVTLIRDMNG